MSMKYLLFVDVETSGIPADFSVPTSEVQRWPYLLQVAWHIYDFEGNLLVAENHFIWEPEIKIEKRAERIHGLSVDDLKAKGEERKSVLEKLLKDLRHYKPVIIGHFVELDSKMLQVGLYRSGLKNNLIRFPHFCTMMATTEYNRFPGHTYPTLGDLYEGLFREKLKRQHDAVVDVEATARCFFELYRRGEIVLTAENTQPKFLKHRTTTKQPMGCGLPIVLLLLSILFCFL